jgi:hypothetical protein
MKITCIHFLILVVLLHLWSCGGEQTSGTASDNTTVYETDIIVYGGTSAAITAAVQAIRMGK